MLRRLFVALNHPRDNTRIVPPHLAERVGREDVAWKLFDSLVLASDDEERERKLRQLFRRRPWIVPIVAYEDSEQPPAPRLPPAPKLRRLISRIYL